MTAEIVNLRQARKLKARAEKERQAEANRVHFGQPRAERDLLAREDELARRRHEGARREAPGNGADGTACGDGGSRSRNDNGDDQGETGP